MNAEIGVIGGSGLYSLLKDAEELEGATEYGRPSSPISVGTIGGRKVAFLSRHGGRHMIPPHKVPYKSNIAALKQLGVKRIIASAAVGSLDPEYKPGELAFFDQYVNMTHGRDDTFYHSTPVTHVSSAEPYCPEMRAIAHAAAAGLGISAHREGTVVVINGPRFSTKAESRMFARQGFNMINMTQYPEAHLALEQEICYLGIGMVTDYDSGLEGRDDIRPVTMEEVQKIFAGNVAKVKDLIKNIVPAVPEGRSRCHCGSALRNAVINP